MPPAPALRRPLQAALFALALAVVLAMSPSAASGQGGAIVAYYPAGDGLVVVVASGGAVGGLVDALAERQCGARTLWRLASDGSPPLGFVPGAPPFVNAEWVEAYGGETVPAEARVLVSCSDAALPGASTSVFADAQVLSLYGYPGIAGMGVLGTLTPSGAADEAARRAAQYDALNGDRDVTPALHPIVAVAQTHPGADGSYLYRMPEETLRQYVDVARERDMLLILDVQGGWADVLEEVQRLEWALVEPFVHLALDPEYMTRSDSLAPGEAIGTITAAEVDAVQGYLAGLVREHRLPPKVLVVHQFLDDMILLPSGAFADEPLVEVLIDMDGFGPPFGKLSKYDRYALAPYAERSGIKLFLLWDEPLLSPGEVQALEPRPDLVIYQ